MLKQDLPVVKNNNNKQTCLTNNLHMNLNWVKKILILGFSLLIATEDIYTNLEGEDEKT